MIDADTNLARLRTLSAGAELWSEPSGTLVYLPGLQVLSGGKTHVVDALLCPRARDGYFTRLFFSEPLPVARNWTAYSILARPWHAISWQGVPAEQSWLDILACHLEAVK